jgi:hypothetical protein
MGQAQQSAAQAEAIRTADDAVRYRALYARDEASKQQLDRAETRARSTAAAQEAALVSDRLWVIANFKETELTLMGRGSFQQRLAGMVSGLSRYSAGPRARKQAYGMMYGSLLQQANLKAYVDMFLWTALIVTLCLLGVWLLKKVVNKGSVAAH